MSYFKERDENNYYKLRDLLHQLPDFSKEFFIGIQNTTSILTRLNYAHDLRIFFDYIVRFYLPNQQYSSKTNNAKNSELNIEAIKSITLGDLASIKAHDLELFLDYLTSYSFNGRKFSCGQSGKERKLSTLRSLFKYFFKKDKLDSNVAAKVDMPKIHEQSITRLEPDEIVQLLDGIQSGELCGFNDRHKKYLQRTRIRDLAIVTLFLGTGIRISELVGLDRSDLDFRQGCFRVTRKGGNNAILYLTEEIETALKNYLDSLDSEISNNTEFGLKIQSSPALFFSLQGNRISLKAVQDLVKKYSLQVAPLKKITPHKLRSTFGTELYRNTHDIYVVADVLGHKDINTTKKHYAAISEDIRRAAAKTVVLREKENKTDNDGE